MTQPVPPRAIILTSTFLRHQAAVNRLADRLDVVGVWQEEKSFVPAGHAGTPDDLAEISRHFAARDAAERRDFSADAALRLGARATVRRVVPSGTNDAAELDAMQALRPDVVLVFGTGILQRELISRFDGRLINLHLGLSPYYRGAGTNFWPLVNREPEYVGATVHYLDSGIDTGPIIAHTRPEVRPSDGPHDIGNRAILAGVEALADAAEAHCRGALASVPQASAGRLYLRRHFTADAVRRLYHQFETGMIPEYLRDRDRRDAALSLQRLTVTA
jgi:folate-dependent phosphoribosylglycinamide formyltransferase PurN